MEVNSICTDFLVDDTVKRQLKTRGVYRLMMKAGTDNFRQSSAKEIIWRITDKGIKVVDYEPELKETKI